MAFPTIPTVAAGRVLWQLATSPSGTHTSPSLTSLTKDPNDLLIALCIIYDGNSTNAEFSAWGGGFTEFGDFATTATMGIGCAYKWSTGSETGTFTVTSADASTNDSAFALLSIPGAHFATPPEAGSYATGTTAAADPASFDPAGWDVEDTLWIAVRGSGETGTGGAYTGLGNPPTNYTDSAQSGISADAVGGVEGGVSFRQLAAASEDVGPGTCDVSNARNAACVIAIRPAQEAIKQNIAISELTGGGTSEKVVGGATYEKDEIAISAFSSSGADEHTAAESGATVSGFSGTGESAVEYVETGTGISALVAIGIAGREFPRAGSATSVFVSSATDVVESVEAGAAISVRSGSSADAVESSESGTAVSAFTALGDGEQSQANDGKGITNFVASGSDASTLSREGAATSGFASSGAVAVTHERSGSATTALVGSGTDATTSGRAGDAISPFTGGGVSQSGGDIIKVGTAVSQFVVSGDATWQVDRSGSVTSPRTGGGVSVSERPRTGVAILIATVAGQSSRESAQAGSVVLVAVAAGDNAVETEKSGAAILTLTGSGNKEGASISKAGTAIMAHSAGGVVINFIVIGGPTADVILAAKARASVRKVSPL